MKHVTFYVIALLLVAPVYAQQQQTEKTDNAKFPDANAFAHTKLTYKIIDAPNKTFGYDIYADGKLMIHQTSIPAMPGNDGFKAKADAEKVAQLVIKKIKKGEMPPTVSVEEMQKLKVIK
jgi:hypothetical protein